MKNVRTCIACRTKKDKKDMLRVAYNKQGEIILDISQKADGRGAYVCNCEDCLNKLIKNKALNRSFKTAVAPEVYEKIGETIGDK